MSYVISAICFSKDDIDTSTFEFIPQHSCKYKIKFEANDHEGSFEVYLGDDDSK